MYLRFQITPDTYDVQCKVVYGTDWYDKRLNHTFARTSDGTLQSWDVGPTLCRCTIVMKDVSSAHATIVRNVIKTYCDFSGTDFNLIQLTDSLASFPSGQGVDLGNGVGTTLTDVNFAFSSTEGIFRLVPPGNYDITLPIEFVRPQ